MYSLYAWELASSPRTALFNDECTVAPKFPNIPFSTYQPTNLTTATKPQTYLPPTIAATRTNNKFEDQKFFLKKWATGEEFKDVL